MKTKPTIGKALIFGICLLANLVYGQKSGCYHFYEFDQFMEAHALEVEAYKKEFSDNLKYLAICRENNQEGDFDFLVFYHGEGAFEIIQKNKREHSFFEDVVNYAFEEAKGKLRGGIKGKFMTIIKIRFDIEPLEKEQGFEFDFIVTAPKVKIKIETSHD